MSARHRRHARPLPGRRLALATLAASLFAPALPAVELRGRVLYENPIAGRNGFAAVDLQPAQGLLVEIFELHGSAEIVAILRTDRNGVFAAKIFGLDLGDGAGARLSASNAAVEVVNELGAVYQWSSLGAGRVIDADPFDLGTVIIRRDQDAGALNITHVITAAWERVRGRLGGGAPPATVRVRWQAGRDVGCGTCYADGEITLRSQGDGPTADTDEFDDHVILHEYARHLARELACDDHPGGADELCAEVDPRLAWSIGLATHLAIETAVAVAAVDDFGSVYLDTVGNPAAGSATLLAADLEANDLCGGVPRGAAGVFTTLWDLQDAPLDDGDDYRRDPADVFAAVADLAGAIRCDATTFAERWCARFGAERGVFAPLFARAGIPLDGCPPRFGLRIHREGTGAGRVTAPPSASDPGIDCGLDCVASLPPGSVVTLATLPEPGSAFGGFSAASAADVADCADGVVTLDGDRTCTARFTRPGGCVADAQTLCLLGGRYQLRAEWENQYSDTRGAALAQPLSGLTGLFAFDDPANVELVVKMLDFGDTVKLFYGQLTDLGFTLTVTETASGKSKRYRNGTGNCGAIDQAVLPKVGPTDGNANAPLATCTADADTLCLLGGRYAVEVTWRNQFNGEQGAGAATALSDLTGLFTFTDPANVELLAKALDFGDRVLFLWGSLSDLGYDLTLVDTVSGAERHYANVPGRFCGGLDPDAF